MSDSITLPDLKRQQDGSWVTSFVPRREENITLLLTVSGRPSGYRVIPVAGRSPFWVDYRTSLASATLVCQGMAQTLQVASGAAAVVYTGENSYVNLPVRDLAGIRWAPPSIAMHYLCDNDCRQKCVQMAMVHCAAEWQACRCAGVCSRDIARYSSYFCMSTTTTCCLTIISCTIPTGSQQTQVSKWC